MFTTPHEHVPLVPVTLVPLAVANLQLPALDPAQPAASCSVPGHPKEPHEHQQVINSNQTALNGTQLQLWDVQRIGGEVGAVEKGELGPKVGQDQPEEGAVKRPNGQHASIFRLGKREAGFQAVDHQKLRLAAPLPYLEYRRHRGGDGCCGAMGTLASTGLLALFLFVSLAN